MAAGFPRALSLQAEAEAEGYHGLGILAQWRMLHDLLAARASESESPLALLEEASGSAEPKLRFLVPGTASTLPGLGAKEVLQLIHPLAREEDLRISEAVQAFGLRPLAEREGAPVRHLLLPWTKDPSPRVRRAVVEALRPRGVWVKHLGWAVESPALLLPLLDSLQADPSRLVCNAVGNSLNDASKAKPEFALEVAGRWLEEGRQGPWTRHVVGKGLRTLVKLGDPRAMKILGLEELKVEAVARLKSVGPIPPNSNLDLELEVRNLGKQEVRAALVCELETTGKNPSKPRRRRRRLGSLLLPKGESCVFRVRERVYDKKSAPLLDGTGRVRFFLNGKEEAEAPFELKRV